MVPLDSTLNFGLEKYFWFTRHTLTPSHWGERAKYRPILHFLDFHTYHMKNTQTTVYIVFRRCEWFLDDIIELYGEFWTRKYFLESPYPLGSPQWVERGKFHYHMLRTYTYTHMSHIVKFPSLAPLRAT